jgi:hypothetical protein
VVQSAIDDYCQVLKEGGKLPPVACVMVDGDLLLVDGFARYYAHEKALKTKIYVQILPGQTRLDAIKYACGANSKHGVPRSNEDRKKATLKAIATWPTLSERKIADICGVSRSFVHKLMPAGKSEESEETKPAKKAKPETKPAKPSTPKKQKQGAPVASEPEYKDLDCPECMGTQFVLSDGGWKCAVCHAPEPEQQKEAELEFEDVEESSTPEPSFDVAKLEIDQAEWKKWLTVFGQLIRATNKCGLYVALQTDLAALKKKAMELAE